MPIFRGKKGEIQETNPDDVTTQIIDRPNQEGSTIDDMPTDIIQGEPEPPTSIITNPGNTQPDQSNQQTDDPATILIRPKRPDTDTETDADAMNDPVVGWVVVIEGPGKGNAVKLGYGQNSIGRAKTERVSLDFGSSSDSQISRSKHAIITYDPKGQKYYLQTGDSVNLTYINDSPILTPTEISGGEHIVIGDTTLRFVPFCGEDFDWQLNS